MPHSGSILRRIDLFESIRTCHGTCFEWIPMGLAVKRIVQRFAIDRGFCLATLSPNQYYIIRRNWFDLSLCCSSLFLSFSKESHIHLVKMTRLLRLARLLQKMDRYSQYAAMILTLLMLCFSLVAHWLACIWYVISEKSQPENEAEWDIGQYCVLFTLDILNWLASLSLWPRVFLVQRSKAVCGVGQQCWTGSFRLFNWVSVCRIHKLRMKSIYFTRRKGAK